MHGAAQRGERDAGGEGDRQRTRTADALLRELQVLWKTQRPLSAGEAPTDSDHSSVQNIDGVDVAVVVADCERLFMLLKPLSECRATHETFESVGVGLYTGVCVCVCVVCFCLFLCV
jgi:hypothetical protein